MMKRFAAAAMLYLWASSLAIAQEQRGLINGTVFDPQGAVVPGAAIVVTDDATGAVFNGKSTTEGTFTIPGLPFGIYSVSITAAGFRKWQTGNVRVITAQEANVKATLQLGSASETSQWKLPRRSWIPPPRN
jgi:hypothetical protein